MSNLDRKVHIKDGKEYLEVNKKDINAGKVSKYALVIGIAKRAREISDMIEMSGSHETQKPVNLAVKDFKNEGFRVLEPVTKEIF